MTYAITGVLIVLVMRMLDEMATANPSTGLFLLAVIVPWNSTELVLAARREAPVRLTNG